MFLSGNNYQLPRRAVVWSGWPFIEIKQSQHTAKCVGSCYLVFAHTRASPAVLVPTTPHVYILYIYKGVGYRWASGGGDVIKTVVCHCFA